MHFQTETVAFQFLRPKVNRALVCAGSLKKAFINWFNGLSFLVLKKCKDEFDYLDHEILLIDTFDTFS